MSVFIRISQGPRKPGGLLRLYVRFAIILVMRKRSVSEVLDFKDLMTFGLFLLALLTFVFSFCK